MAELITNPEVARLLGVTPTTIKRWVADGRLQCITTPGGHRRFERAEVERFRRTLGGQSEDVVFQLLQHMLDGSDSYKLQSLMIEMRGRLASWWRVADILSASLFELGRQWEQGTCSVSQEHDASRRFQQAVWACGAGLPSPPVEPRCILAAAEQEQHTLSLSLAEICLREAGRACLWLGSPTPTSVLIEAIQEVSPGMVVVSASSYNTDAKSLDRQFQLIADACRGCGAELVLGGEGAWPRNPSRGHRVHSFAEFAKLLAHSNSGQ